VRFPFDGHPTNQLRAIEVVADLFHGRPSSSYSGP
jgi:hypothetical protein